MITQSFNANSKTPLISLIIPVYNMELYLRQCLDSAISQTYPNLEILIVDDGSTDGSAAICGEYAQRGERIRVFHTENRGLSEARNYALDRARGDFFAFLDSDDILESEMLEKLMNALRQYGADVAACPFSSFRIDRTVLPPAKERRLTVFEGLDLRKQAALCDQVKNVVWNKLYRAELFDGIRFPADRLYEDVATVYRVLLRAERVVLIPDVLIRRRMRRSSLSCLVTRRSLSDYWWAYSTKYLLLREAGSEFADSALIRCFAAAGHISCRVSGLPKDEKEQFGSVIHEIRAFCREHFREVMKNRKTPLIMRLRAPFLLAWSAPVLRCQYAAKKLFSVFRGERAYFP